MVRIWQASKLARDTHILERAEVVIGDNIESKQASKGYLPTKRGQRLGLARIWKASKGHSLSREGRGW